MSGESPASEFPIGMPRNYLRPALLLLLGEGTSHGYELLEQVAALGLDRLDPGGLYRCLRAMDEEGLVTSVWEPSTSGPARRTYALTDDGQEWLHLLAGSLADVGTLLATFQLRYRMATGQIDRVP